MQNREYGSYLSFIIGIFDGNWGWTFQIKCVLTRWNIRESGLASLAKWLSVHLQTKWLWVRISLLSLKLQIWHLLRGRSSLIFRQTIDCRFILKLVCDMIITSSHIEFILEEVLLKVDKWNVSVMKKKTNFFQ